MELSARHWSIALTCAVGLHLSLVAFFDRPAGPSSRVPGILIELGDAGRPGDDTPGSEGPGAPAAEDLPDPEPPIAQTAVPESPPEIQAQQPEAPTPDSPPQTSLPAEAAPTPDTEQIIEDPPARAKPIAAARPQAKPKQRAKATSAKSKKKSPAIRQPGKTAQSTNGKAGGGTGGRSASPPGAGTAVSTAMHSRYTGQIAAWLNRNKRYPQRARRLGQQGLVTVRFTLDREGRVLDFSILRSSGHASLDDEVRNLMRRGRMPRMPAAMQGSRMTMMVPIHFRLQ